MRISPEYLAEQKRLHADPRGYGGRGDKWADQVVTIAAGVGAASVLDYGCGQGSLKRELERLNPRLRVSEYDPAIPGKDGEPPFADLVVCTDVLEHVEEKFVDAVLMHLATLARRAVFVVVSTVPTEKTLSAGRQAHITLKPEKWWLYRASAAGLVVREKVLVKKPGKEFALVLEPMT